MATYVVTVLDVTGDNAGVSGSLADEISDGGGLSLTEAITLANGSGTSSRITFDPTLSGGTIYLRSGPLPSITRNVVIDGDLDNDHHPDITISGDALGNDTTVHDPDGNVVTAARFNNYSADNHRIFYIGEGHLTLEGLVLTGGAHQSHAGAIYITSGQEATIRDSSISGNTSEFNAGAIFNRGRLTVDNSIFYGNSSTNFWTGSGGAIRSHGTSTIGDSLFEGNEAARYGGAFAHQFGGGVNTFTNTVFKDNLARDGGAIYSGEPTVLINSTLVGNVAEFGGGAIYFYQGGANRLVITNSTITGNYAGSVGGGIRNSWRDNVDISNSLILGNNSGFRPDLYADIWGGITQIGPNIIGGSVSQLFELVQTVDPDGIASNGDEFLAGALYDNGGPRETVALRRALTNPALDRGDDSQSPTADARGLDRFVDVPGISRGAGLSDLGAFEVQMTDPIAVDDAFATLSDTTVSGSVLADNGSGADYDPDGDALHVSEVGGSRLSVGIARDLLSGATVRVDADGQFQYDPNGAFKALRPLETATDTFRYTIEDIFGGSDIAEVTVTITGVNDPPVPVDDTFVTDEDQPRSIDVLQNDTDPESDPLVITAIGGQSVGQDDVGGSEIIRLANGSLLVGSDGSLTYAPNLNFNGTEIFTYTVEDGYGAEAQATAQIIVEPANDAPEIQAPLAVSVQEVIGDFRAIATATASDVDGDDLTFSVSGGADAALFEIDPLTGVLGFREAPDFEIPRDADEDGEYEVEIGVSDGIAITHHAMTVNVLDFAEITGTSRRDVLTGTDGPELLDGEAGNDYYLGGAGEDIFVLGAREFDRVGDYEPGVDRLDISQWGVSTFDDLRILSMGGSGYVLISDGSGNHALVYSGDREFEFADELDSGDFIL